MCRANDICKESKRQIINAEDIFKALEETEFSEFVRPLKASLEGHFHLPILTFFLASCDLFFSDDLSASGEDLMF